ncbi:hypothetical protein COL11_27365 [Bacillus anthracis]|nr:hypothetical protein COL11_27365 [Bacillus anthracis]
MNLLDLNVLDLTMGQQLFIARYLRGEMQSEVAEKLGISQIQVSAIERGHAKVPKRCHANALRYLYGGDSNAQ